MAAITTTMLLLEAGDHVIVSENTYGGTYRLFERVFANFGLEFSYVDTTSAENVERAWGPKTRMVFLEIPTNPIMSVADLGGIGALCRDRDVRMVVDNTFLSPFFLRPIAHGASLVIHSTTKYLNGHSDSGARRFSAECGGGYHFTPRCLAGFTWHQDVNGSDGAPCRKRTAGGAIPG
jgi:cystathionine beta-lyase/cystathionine gamma-synthase